MATEGEKRRRRSPSGHLLRPRPSLPVLALLASLALLLARLPAASSSRSGGGGRRPHDAALRTHRRHYSSRNPPHETSLYDALGVSPNATAADLDRAYRRRSRDFHPDKVRARAAAAAAEAAEAAAAAGGRDSSDSSSDGGCFESESDVEAECGRRLTEIREAYEVLRDDRTRLLYHRFGLRGMDGVASLLTGGAVGSAAAGQGLDSERRERLLRLMGYDTDLLGEGDGGESGGSGSGSGSRSGGGPSSRRERRVAYLAAGIVETIRPLVEGSIDQADLAQWTAAECDDLKTSPLGAQIVRCVGRAYRHSGQRVLRRHRRREGGQRPGAALRLGLDWSDAVRSGLRDAKNVADAALTSGKMVLEEHNHRRTTIGRESGNSVLDLGLSAIEYPIQEFGEPPGDSDEEEEEPFSKDAIQEIEQKKAREAVLGALQVEALWKLSKIDLDRTVREACERILEGGYFFFPSHQSPDVLPGVTSNGDGWVGSSGEVIETNIGKLRAAAALILVGDVMVQQSKEDTAWVD